MLDSRASWTRLGLLLLLSSIGGVGMWSVVVTLPAVQVEFGVARAGAALPYTLTMLGFAAGGVVMGRATDRFGIAWVAAVAGLMLAAGYALASFTHDLLTYALVHGVLVGMLGSGALFGPVMADASLWFRRRRGLAVAIAAAGVSTYFAISGLNDRSSFGCSSGCSPSEATRVSRELLATDLSGIVALTALGVATWIYVADRRGARGVTLSAGAGDHGARALVTARF